MGKPTASSIQLWDVPTRLFHWLLMVTVAAAITSGLLGGNWMDLHGQVGLAICGLLVFRLAWGFVGNHYARFATFVPTPTRLLGYLKGNWQGIGHNPLGAMSVLALLGLLSLQVSTGLLSNDEIAFTGPLAGLVGEALSLRLTGLHHQLANVLFVLLGLHVMAILFHALVKKDNLVKPMLTGIKKVDKDTTYVTSKQTRWLSVLTALALALGVVYLCSGAAFPEKAISSAAPSIQASPPKPAW
jgi:cytochrome b